VRTSLLHPDLAHADAGIPSGEAAVQGLSAAQAALYAQVLDGGIGRLLRVPFVGPGAGHPKEVPLPLKAAVLVEATDPRLPGVLFGLTSCESPGGRER
jgi:prolyl oligopeptidase